MVWMGHLRRRAEGTGGVAPKKKKRSLPQVPGSSSSSRGSTPTTPPTISASPPVSPPSRNIAKSHTTVAPVQSGATPSPPTSRVERAESQPKAATEPTAAEVRRAATAANAGEGNCAMFSFIGDPFSSLCFISHCGYSSTEHSITTATTIITKTILV